MTPLQTSIFDAIVPYITRMDLGTPATIDCHFPPQFQYNGEEIEKYFDEATVNAEYIDPVYVGKTKVRGYELLSTHFHGVFKDRSVAEYLCVKTFGK